VLDVQLLKVFDLPPEKRHSTSSSLPDPAPHLALQIVESEKPFPSALVTAEPAAQLVKAREDLVMEWTALKERAGRDGVDPLSVIPGVDDGRAPDEFTAVCVDCLLAELRAASRLRARLQARMTPARLIREESLEVRRQLRAVAIQTAAGWDPRKPVPGQIGDQVMWVLERFAEVKYAGSRLEGARDLARNFRRDIDKPALFKSLDSRAIAAGKVARAMGEAVVNSRKGQRSTTEWERDLYALLKLLPYHFHGCLVVYLDRSESVSLAERAEASRANRTWDMTQFLADAEAITRITCSIMSGMPAKTGSGKIGAVSLGLTGFRRMFKTLCTDWLSMDETATPGELIREVADVWQLEQIWATLNALCSQLPTWAFDKKLKKTIKCVGEWIESSKGSKSPP
jgi:hypothetical protein